MSEKKRSVTAGGFVGDKQLDLLEELALFEQTLVDHERWADHYFRTSHSSRLHRLETRLRSKTT